MKWVCFCAPRNERQCANILDKLSARINLPPGFVYSSALLSLVILAPIHSSHPSLTTRRCKPGRHCQFRACIRQGGRPSDCSDVCEAASVKARIHLRSLLTKRSLDESPARLCPVGVGGRECCAPACMAMERCNAPSKEVPAERSQPTYPNGHGRGARTCVPRASARWSPQRAEIHC
jgi:hypothetical protein